jgi:hypothetical protein
VREVSGSLMMYKMIQRWLIGRLTLWMVGGTLLLQVLLRRV